jgi:hypothetical protein
MLARHGETMQVVRAARAETSKKLADAPALLSWDSTIQFRRRDGLPEIPIWLDSNGRRYPLIGVPVFVYPYYLQHFCERLVALDNPPREGGKAEWIEYSSFWGDEPTRKFVRVDLLFEANLSATIDLHETRIVKGETTIWWRNERV